MNGVVLMTTSAAFAQKADEYQWYGGFEGLHASLSGWLGITLLFFLK